MMGILCKKSKAKDLDGQDECNNSIMKDEKLVRETVPTRKRAPGPTRMRWKENIKISGLNKMSIPFECRLTEVRTGWRKVIHSAKTHPELYDEQNFSALSLGFL